MRRYTGRVRFIAWLVLVAAIASGAHAEESPGASYAHALEEAGLDPDASYRVRDLSFQKEDLRFYLNEGYLIFSKPVAGRRFAAVFTADLPGGDAEVIVLPPQRGERASLARFTKSPNMNEHFAAALFLFTDGTGEQLLSEVESGSQKKVPDIGASLATAYNATLKNIAISYELRLVQDHFSARPQETGFFYAGINGKQLGTFDMLLDWRQRDQVVVGQLVFRQERSFFDVWTSFPARSFRTSGKQFRLSNADLADIRIDASLDGPDLRMKARTGMTFTPRYDGDSVLAFELSRRVQITSATVDGQPVEVYSPDSLRVNGVRAGDNRLFLVLLPQPMKKGEKHRIEFQHEGNVVTAAGNGVYFVASRLNWYPNREAAFARYEMSFRYPKHLKLVATGDLAEEKTEGEHHISRFVTSTPIRFAGFNLGDYKTTRTSRAGVSIEVCANRALEAVLQMRHELPSPAPMVPLPGRRTPPPTGTQFPAALPPVQPSPAGRLDQLTADIGGTLEYLASVLGPPPIKTLSVSPIPGAFGQGFPGLLYISTLAYLNPSDAPVRSDFQRLFFSELLHAHETAHQWWGNLVTSAQYQDDWLMEALANYSAMLVLEKRKGRRALQSVLDEYRNHLLAKAENEQPVESAGPIVWGTRLSSSQASTAWRTIMYEKGSWILHMLRERMGDERFLKMLGEITRRKQFAALSTEEFRQIASEFLPPGSGDPKLEGFFDSWVYNTGIPGLKLSYKVEGRAPKIRIRGEVTQADVGEEFGTFVPVDVTLPGNRQLRRWVQTSGDVASFTVDLPQAPVKVAIDSVSAVLARK